MSAPLFGRRILALFAIFVIIPCDHAPALMRWTRLAHPHPTFCARDTFRDSVGDDVRRHIVRVVGGE